MMRQDAERSAVADGQRRPPSLDLVAAIEGRLASAEERQHNKRRKKKRHPASSSAEGRRRNGSAVRRGGKHSKAKAAGRSCGGGWIVLVPVFCLGVTIGVQLVLVQQASLLFEHPLHLPPIHLRGPRERHPPSTEGKGLKGGEGSRGRGQIVVPPLHPERDTESIRPLDQILSLAQVPPDPVVTSKLPSTTEVEGLYGRRPLILGLETCSTFRNQLADPAESFIGVAGLFNSGTNLLAESLKHNCYIPARVKVKGEKSNGMRDQVPWGKHSPAYWRGKWSAKFGADILDDNVMVAVVIKDPLTWMSSMCRHPYTAEWPHNAGHCPNLVPVYPVEQRKAAQTGVDTIPVRVKYRPENVTSHDSLVELWNDWYGDYIEDVEFPRIVVRFEDLLFHIEEVVTEVCHCGGGVMRQEDDSPGGGEGGFRYIADSAKKGAAHRGSSTLSAALTRYGNATVRTEAFTKPDLRYAAENLRKDLLEAFHYDVKAPP